MFGSCGDEKVMLGKYQILSIDGRFGLPDAFSGGDTGGDGPYSYRKKK